MKIKGSYRKNQRYAHLKNKVVPLSDSAEGSLAVFVHIPKTGGTSLKNILTLNYGKRYRSYHPIMSNLYETPEMIGELRAISAHRPFGYEKDLIQAYRDAVSREDAICEAKPVVFSVVRNPLERVISLYNFVTTFPAHSLHNEMRDLEPEEFYEKLGSKGVSNLQTRFICGAGKKSNFKLARERIENDFSIVVDLANQDKLIHHLSDQLGWKLPDDRIVANRSPKKLTRENISGELEDFLNSRMEEDWKLYDFVREMSDSL